jgi:hypothetical protein
LDLQQAGRPAGLKLATRRIATGWWLLPLLAVALWLRWRNLGALGFVVDEGNQALAIRGILEHGLPVVDSGLVYARNLLYMLAQALSAGLLGLDEASLRLPSVLFGVGAVGAAYALASDLFDRPVALLTALLLALSAWEIELSRYARFYTAFQCLFVVALICFYRGFLQDRRPWRIAFWVAAVLTVMSHELGGLLAVCFLVPLALDRYTFRRKLIFAAGFAGVLAVWTGYRKLFDVVRVALQSAELQRAGPAPDVMNRVRLELSLPKPKLPDLEWVAAAFGRQPLVVAALGLLVLATVAWLLRVGLRRGKPSRVLLLAAAPVAAFLQLFTVAVTLLALQLVIFVRGRPGFRDRCLPVAAAVVLACFVFWLAAFTFATDVPFGQAWRKLFGYPDLRNHFFHWMSRGWPVLTWIFAAGGIALLFRCTNRADDPRPLYLLSMIFVPLLLTSSFRSYHEARYVFHLYPLVVLVVAATLVGVGRRLLRVLGPRRPAAHAVAAGGLVVLALFGLRDSDPRAAWALGAREYGSPKDPVRSVINWSMYADFHQDHKTPALWVAERVRPGDRIVAAGPSHMAGVYHYYTGGVTHVLGRPRDRAYYRRTPDGRTIGWVTGSEVVKDVAGVEALRQPDAEGTTWLLADERLLHPDNRFYDDDLKRWLQQAADRRAFTGRDGRTFVVALR